MKISKVMKKEVVACGAADTLERAAHLMWERDLGSVVVLDDDGRVAGMITDRDICMAAYTRGEPLRAIPVAAAMARVVHTCKPDQDVQSVEHEMARAQVRRMPVVDVAGHPIGIVSLYDLARATQHDGGLSPAEVTSTLAAVCAPRTRALAIIG